MNRRHALLSPLVGTLAVLLGAAVGAPTIGHAQTRVTGGQFRQNEVVDRSLLARGRKELGLSLAGAMSFGSVTPEGGEAVSQSTLYVVPSVVGGYMLTDNVELRLTLGAQILRQTVGDADPFSTAAFVTTLQCLYERDLILGLGWYAGIGAGGFYGSRTAPVSGAMRLKYTNFGGVGQLLAGLLMQPGPTLLLRGGIRLDALFGSETPEDEAISPKTTFFNTQVVFEVSIGWRFG